MPRRLSLQVDVPLAGDVDFERVLSEIPSTFEAKGMFFSRYVNALEGAWEDLSRTLDAPARHGRYHAFESYPMRDWLRLFDRVARDRFPGSTREAYRLMARGEVEVFSESTLGRVAFSLAKDPTSILLRFPDLLQAVTNGLSCRTERVDDRRVVVRYERLIGSTEQAIGLVEGLVLAFEEKPAIEVTFADDGSASFDVTW